MKRTIAALLVLAGGWTPAACAQPPPEPPPRLIALRPAAEPVPALRYRLVPEQTKLVPGNAANFYYRAVIMMKEAYAGLAAREKAQPGAFPASVEQVASYTWPRCSIGEIPREQARKYLEPFQAALKEVELGASRSTCEWEFDQRTEGVYLMLPEIQEMRRLARQVMLKARLAILDGATADAMHWIETGLVMGRHVSEGPLAIQAFVGIAVDRQMIRCLEDLIDSPAGPNLFWALADRPRPFIDMRRPMEDPRYLLEREVSELNDLDRGAWSLDQARRFAETLERKLAALDSAVPTLPGDGSRSIDLRGLPHRLGLAAVVAKIYPEARRALIARGRPEPQVEAMPVFQVVALYTMQEYQRVRDDAYKWMNIPYFQVDDRIAYTDRLTAGERRANPLLGRMYDLLRAVVGSTRLPLLGLERELDGLQCVEAIRLYASAHDGKLPPTLEAITDVPAPLDPATGRPFLYQADGDSATLTAPAYTGSRRTGATDQRLSTFRYELKLAK
jgi:hypothetical protein